MSASGSQMASSFFSLGPQPMGSHHPHSGWVFLPQLYISINALDDMPRAASPNDSKCSHINSQHQLLHLSIDSTKKILKLWFDKLVLEFQTATGPTET